jgi:archaellum biogenesis protein FlaJ (TadC family)
MSRAVESVLTTDFGLLNELILKLHRRLKLRIDGKICWQIFAWETGSSLIVKYTNIFYSAAGTGTNSEELASILYDSALKDLAFRKRRGEVSGYVKGLLMPLQATLTAILTLIKSLLAIFSAFSIMVSGFLTFMSAIPEAYLDFYFTATITTLTFGNALALYFIEKESVFTLLFYLGIFLIIAGGIGFAMSWGTENIMSMFTRFGSELSSLTPS